MQDAISFCRICSGQCGVKITVDDERRIVKIRGDKDHPLTRGYACAKGVASAETHNSPDRLLHPMKRQEDGSFAPIGLNQALDEIAAKLSRLIDEDGPRTVATFVGTWGYNNAALAPMLKGFMDAIGSPSRFTSLTVDQSAKIVTIGRMGRWSAGRQGFSDADVWMIFGGNPLVSVTNTTGVPASHPLKQLQQAKARGMRIVVIDPRLTETARFADIHLQPLPGSDVAIAAGLIRIILDSDLHDADFCARHVGGMDALRDAVEPFTPEWVEARSGVPADLLRAAAEMWGGADKRGCAYTSTGPCMSGFSNLADHMVELLNVICGRFLREDEPLENGLSVGPRRAEVMPPSRWWESGPRGRSRDFGALPGVIGRELPCGILADEILTPGDGRIRSLFVAGGNPALSFPDQEKVVRALKSLDLLVAIDPFMSATARVADYVIPPLMQFERADTIHIDPQVDLLPIPFIQFTKAVASPPAGSELIEDWYLFWALAVRLGLELTVSGDKLDMSVEPDAKALIRRIAQPREIPFDEIWEEPRGRIFDRSRVVSAGRPDRDAKLDVVPADVIEELRQFREQSFADAGRFTHLLASRRMRDAMNSMHHEAPTLRDRHSFNPAYMNPGDLAAMGLVSGDAIYLESDHGQIEGIVEADETVRSGVVQMSHAWGGLPGETGRFEDIGANTGRLISNEQNCQTINAMARQSAVPVNIHRRTVEAVVAN